MTLANMRENGTRSIRASCPCGHEATLNVDHLPADLPVPDVALRLRCSACGGRKVTTMPQWSERPWRIQG